MAARSRFLNKIGDKVKRTGEKFDDQLDRVQAGISRLPTAIRVRESGLCCRASADAAGWLQYTYNPKWVYVQPASTRSR